jgi:exopolyphosphatase/pppGpp-phosphohydrolase
VTPDPVTPDDIAPGSLFVAIGNDRVDISMTGGGAWTIPLGPQSLFDGVLEQRDKPSPSHLTNALGFIHDYFDDIVVLAPSVLAAPSVAATGPHAVGLARVELGNEHVPTGYHLQRADADEVFRTLVAEPRAERLHNPGLAPSDVDTIIGTLCIVLAIMRRLDLGQLAIQDDTQIHENAPSI